MRFLLDLACDLAEAVALLAVAAFIACICLAMSPDPTPTPAAHQQARGPVAYAESE